MRSLRVYGRGGFLALFALLAAAFGLFMAVRGWHQVIESRTILTTWESVPAKIESAELKTHRGSKGGLSFRATGVYSYTYGGRSYHSDRVSLSDGFDNVGDFHQRVYGQMHAAMRYGQLMDCRVNPDDPSQSVLRAEWRPELGLFNAVFGVVFGAVGLGVLAGVVVNRKIASQESRYKSSHPSEPWLWREEWRNTEMRPRLVPVMVMSVGGLVWMNLVTWPLWSGVREVAASDGSFKWLFFAVLGLVAIASGFCVRKIIHARKFRDVRLVVDSLPLQPGAEVVTRLSVPHVVPSGGELRLALVAERIVISGDGKKRRTTKTKLWSQGHREWGPIAPRQEVVVRFRLPLDVVETTVDDTSDDSVQWRYEARANLAGVNLHVDFELPVFNRIQTS